MVGQEFKEINFKSFPYISLQPETTNVEIIVRHKHVCLLPQASKQSLRERECFRHHQMSKLPLEMPSSDRLIACQSILVIACVLGEKQYLQLLQDHQRNVDNALTAHVFLNQRRSLTVRFECFVSIFYLVLFPILTIRPMSSFECSV